MSHISAIFFIIFLSCVALLTLVVMPPQDDRWVAAIFPPKTSPQHVVEAVRSAGGKLVRAGRWANIAVVQFDEKGRARLLREHGAWLTVDPVLLQGCGLVDGRVSRPSAPAAKE